jgi:hypothetical protein
MTHLPLHTLQELRVTVLAVAGIARISPNCFLLIAMAIQQKTGVVLNEVTLKRFYGFLPSRFPPSPFTTDTLVKFCGYSCIQDWQEKAEPPPEGQIIYDLG